MFRANGTKAIRRAWPPRELSRAVSVEAHVPRPVLYHGDSVALRGPLRPPVAQGGGLLVRTPRVPQVALLDLSGKFITV